MPFKLTEGSWSQYIQVKQIIHSKTLYDGQTEQGKIFELVGKEIQHELTAMLSKMLAFCFRCSS